MTSEHTPYNPPATDRLLVRSAAELFHSAVLAKGTSAYHRRLLMYKGEISPDSLLHADSTADDRALQLATQGYGVGNWYLANGEPEKAEAIFREVLDGSYWSAFGYIAAEVDVQRMEEER